MRTALLPTLKRTASGQLRSEQIYVGRSVLEWQVDLALALRCKRVVCLCDATHDFILTVQKKVEARGVEFHTVRSNLQLVGLVRADDELVMLADGLVIERTFADHMLDADGHFLRAIITIPSEHRLAHTHPDDFERVDHSRHWAGLAIMRADQLHKLADMPPDSAPVSLLLRLALQARVACRDWGGPETTDGKWLLATDQSVLAAREKELIAHNIPSTPATAPFHALSAIIVRRVGIGGHAVDPKAIAGIGLAVMLVGMVTAYFAFAAVGLFTAACGAFIAMVAHRWIGLRANLWSLPENGALPVAISLSVDAVAIGCLVLAFADENPPLPALALPFFPIGISNALARGGPTAPAIPFWDDRALHLAVLAVAAAFGFLGEALALAGVASLGYFVVRSHRATG